MLRPGTNTIKGSGLIRQQGGGVVTCAGNEVVLIPATAYSTERMKAIYPSAEGGLTVLGEIRFEPNPPEYRTTVRTTKCDAQGSFVYDRVADGKFFVVSSVVWYVRDIRQGGNMMKSVTLSGGETKTVVLSP